MYVWISCFIKQGFSLFCFSYNVNVYCNTKNFVIKRISGLRMSHSKINTCFKLNVPSIELDNNIRKNEIYSILRPYILFRIGMKSFIFDFFLWLFVKHVMTHEDPKVQPTLPRRATIVHDHPTKVKSSFKQLHHMD